MKEIASFRSAPFGGFQRQDVLDYLKKSTEETNAQIASLQRSLQEAEERNTQKEYELNEARGRIQDAQEKARQAKESEESLTEQLHAVQSELEQAKDQLEGYARLKSDYAEIEVDARRRAASLIDKATLRATQIEEDAKSEANALLEQARADADEIRDKAEQDARDINYRRRALLESTRRDFERWDREMKTVIASALADTEQIHSLLTNAETTFDGRFTTMDSLCTEEV